MGDFGKGLAEALVVLVVGAGLLGCMLGALIVWVFA